MEFIQPLARPDPSAGREKRVVGPQRPLNPGLSRGVDLLGSRSSCAHLCSSGSDSTRPYGVTVESTLSNMAAELAEY